MRKSVKTEQQIGFVLTLIKEDIEHYENQQQRINKWIQKSILSLKYSELCSLEELRDEYRRKVDAQRKILKEFNVTIEMYKNNISSVHFPNSIETRSEY
ncbi:hypothetical protein [Neobacillus dielmonensis]|uniref:hypothetical protein n=1 Tax=Neobacillus dielmonensis TaxID=1347369 RepID=UPI0005A7A8B0|nr:hypothetical protein [Neobacillus dielmonensis]